MVEWYWQEKTELLGNKTVLMLLRPQQISHGPNKPEISLKSSPYRAVNGLHLGYKNQSVNAV